jgi:hypothetical protein
MQKTRADLTVLDETRTAFPMFLVQKTLLGAMSLEEITYRE